MNGKVVCHLLHESPFLVLGVQRQMLYQGGSLLAVPVLESRRTTWSVLMAKGDFQRQNDRS